MALPFLVWGVFQIGARVAATAAGRQAISYVVKKITPKIIKKYGDPVSKHKTAEVAKKIAKQQSEKAKKAAEKAAEKVRKQEAAKVRAEIKKGKAKDKKRADEKQAKLKQERGEARTGVKTETKPRKLTKEEVAAAGKGLPRSVKTSSQPSPAGGMGRAAKELAKNPKVWAGAAVAASLLPYIPKGKDRTPKKVPPKPIPRPQPPAKEKPPAKEEPPTRPEIKPPPDPKPKEKPKEKDRLTNKQLAKQQDALAFLRRDETQRSGVQTVVWNGKIYGGGMKSEGDSKKLLEDIKTFNIGKERPEDKKGGGRVSSRPAKVMKQYVKGGSVRKPKRIK